MKNPSLHITLTDLTKVLKKLGRNPSAGDILRESKKYSITSRCIIPNSETEAKKVKKINSSDLKWAYEFSKTLYLVRRQRRHIGNINYDETHKDWPTIKQITKEALLFCENFDLEPKEGFKEFLNIVFTKLKTFSPNRVLPLVGLIADWYKAQLRIKTNKHKELTQRAYSKYNELVVKGSGFFTDYEKEDPIKFVPFIEVAELCYRKYQSEVEIFIVAQFEGLAWKNSIPDPLQLTTEKAIERFIKYLYENKIKLKPEKEKVVEKVDWNKIKRNR